MIVYETTMNEFERAAARTPVAVFPVGSVEEHGGHLPLGTDTLQVVEVARRATELSPALVCPPLHYGYCRSTRDHPGTLSISPETVRRLVFDVGAALRHNGVRGLIVMSGHAGGIHMAALEEAGEHLVERFDDMEVAVVCEYHWAQEAGRQGLVETANDGHAGEIETSRVLAVVPGWVRGSSPEEYPNLPRPFIARAKRPHWPGGVWGDPGRATAAKGEQLLEASARRLAELIDEMKGKVRER